MVVVRELISIGRAWAVAKPFYIVPEFVAGHRQSDAARSGAKGNSPLTLS